MKRRIRFIYALTICVIAAYCIAQGYWLWTHYQQSVQEYEQEQYAKIVESIEEEIQTRKNMPVSSIRWYGSTQTYLSSDSSIVWNLAIYSVEGKWYGKAKLDTLRLATVENAYKNGERNYIKKHEFRENLSAQLTNEQAPTAIERFRINEEHPFKAGRLDSILRSKDIYADLVNTANIDSLMWNPTMEHHTAWLHPSISVTYPLDILRKQTLTVSLPLGLSSVIRRMFYTLCLTTILSIVLIFCLIYQIITIRKQRRIEELRQDFVRTMIHELKRPISTLKMCVSFMGNERMMQDKESQQNILASSHQELDNLTAYFAKLRDITVKDASRIPLVWSRFPLRPLLTECIKKQNPPSGKQVNMEVQPIEDLMVCADRMHLANIICNLLENAIKYSGKTVTITIDYQKDKQGHLLLTIADNGNGISKSDSHYVFDPFFRSHTAQSDAIPGIGLGLSYVKLLVEAHGGSISFSSIEHKGTTFTIILPQDHEENQDTTR